ncbi:MAG: phosphatidate cytidylyltransferase, partial [Egibacteraceae bacterium]
MAADPAPSDAPVPGPRRLGRNLPVAVAVGLTLAALFLGTLAADPYAFLTFIAVCVVLGLFELDTAFRQQGWRPAT